MLNYPILFNHTVELLILIGEKHLFCIRTDVIGGPPAIQYINAFIIKYYCFIVTAIIAMIYNIKVMLINV